MLYHKVANYETHLKSLSAACDWIGIQRGRAVQYVRLIREFYEGSVERSREHILAYNESCEITTIHELWTPHINSFPGLHEKIRSTFSKGPLLCEDENTQASSNKARNDAFVYLLAGKLLKASVAVVAVEGILSEDTPFESNADITFDWNGSVIDVECKRPQHQRKVQKRIQEACDQLAQPERLGRLGMIGLDCSTFIRPLGMLMEKGSVEEADRILAQKLFHVGVTRQTTALKPAILGLLLFARVPAMIRVGQSAMLSVDGKPFQQYFRPESIEESLAIINAHSPARQVLQTVCQMLHRSMHED
jgi:hypothetical protein